MSFNLVLNSTNVASVNNNIFLYNFINGGFKINEEAEICISEFIIPYSWFNITQQYNNNSFIFNDWFGISHEIIIPNGFYQVSDLNSFFVNYCLNNGFYLVSSNGLNVVFNSFLSNATYYSNQILSYTVPTLAEFNDPSGNYAGWSLGSDWVGFPPVSTAPSIQILNNNFQSYLGFSAGIYGGGVNDSSFLSNITPNATNVNSLIVRCSLINNNVAMPTDILDSFPITSTFGSNIIYSPRFPKFLKIKPGTYNNLTLTIVDQNFNTVYAQDPNVCITLLIKF
jgi:hypothetical protein